MQGFQQDAESCKYQAQLPFILISGLSWKLCSGLWASYSKLLRFLAVPWWVLSTALFTGSDNKNSLSCSVNLEWTEGEQPQIHLLPLTPNFVCMTDSMLLNPFNNFVNIWDQKVKDSVLLHGLESHLILTLNRYKKLPLINLQMPTSRWG